ncbi:MAG: phosphoribosylformylglycinamidine synthase subunit PurS [Rickettsiales bacterium]
MAAPVRENAQRKSDKTMKYRVDVSLKEGVLDPQGAATLASLRHLGYDEAAGARIGRFIELDLTCASEKEAEAQVEKMCGALLVNGVIEQYRVSRVS